jgi:hypothetical protein
MRHANILWVLTISNGGEGSQDIVKANQLPSNKITIAALLQATRENHETGRQLT